MNTKRIRIIAVCAAAIAIIFIFPNQVAYLARMLVIAWVVAFALEPMCNKFARKLPRGLSAWLCLLIVAGVLALVALALVPSIVIQTRDVIKMLPSIMARANEFFGGINDKLVDFGLDGINMRSIDIPGKAIKAVETMASSAGSFASGATAFFLGILLGVFLLIDIDEARFRAELLVPAKWRELSIKMARDVSVGLKMYVRGQLTVSVIVGGISALALWLIGVKSPVALGAIIGIFNIIPYFGPIFGGIPVVLIALSQSLVTALFAVAALFLVQQADSAVISPRVMAGATGLKPTSTIIAMSIGGAGWGPLGMLIALPVMIIMKIALRTWASRND